MSITHSLIIPVYCNEAFLPDVLRVVQGFAAHVAQSGGSFEVVFVVDGSPDRSEQRLLENLPASGVPSQLIVLSRNFGSFTAVPEIMPGEAADRGHIFPLSYFQLRYLFGQHGMRVKQVLEGKYKRKLLFQSYILLLPLVWLATRLMQLQLATGVNTRATARC